MLSRLILKNINVTPAWIGKDLSAIYQGNSHFLCPPNATSQHLLSLSHLQSLGPLLHDVPLGKGVLSCAPRPLSRQFVYDNCSSTKHLLSRVNYHQLANAFKIPPRSISHYTMINLLQQPRSLNNTYCIFKYLLSITTNRRILIFHG